jgi:homogentisate 1,2-dioxygenase
MENSLAFMFETAYLMKLSEHAMAEENVDTTYYKCWEGLTKQFNKDEI